ncbi:MAG: cbb3-type cytochrome oxidase assembly protein CcoS [Polyangiaceae bacterium]|nr:cbb3-type cytochrome oxidase assembly protein CcoS [Polyangiaceae bacterium]
MSVLYIVLPLAVLLAGGAVMAYLWTVRSGQLDDLDTPPARMLQDDVPRRRPRPEMAGAREPDDTGTRARPAGPPTTGA